jgi:hypothetical protein
MKSFRISVFLFLLFINLNIFSENNDASSDDKNGKTVFLTKRYESLDFSVGGSFLTDSVISNYFFDEQKIHFVESTDRYVFYQRNSFFYFQSSLQVSLPFCFSYNLNGFIGIGFTIKQGFKLTLSNYNMSLNPNGDINFLFKAGNLARIYFLLEIGATLTGNISVYKYTQNCFLAGPDMFLGLGIYSMRGFVFSFGNIISCTMGDTSYLLTNNLDQQIYFNAFNCNINIGIEFRFMANFRKYLK